MSINHDINFYRLDLQRNISDITDKPSLSPVFSDPYRQNFQDMMNRSSQSASPMGVSFQTPLRNVSISLDLILTSLLYEFQSMSSPGFLRKNCIRTRGT